MSSISREDVDRFRAIIEEHLGLSCADWQAERLPSLLRERIDQSRCDDVEDYLLSLTRPGFMENELGALAEPLTVGETYFFREPKQIEAFIEIALPMIIRRRRTGPPLRILSAGCSSGEEAHSVAIALQQYFEETGYRETSILGVDMNPAAIRRARRAQYSAWSLRATPPAVRDRWFTRRGNEYRLRETIRKMVTFDERNLLADDPGFWKAGVFDVVFCRNVTIYFSIQAMRTLVARIERAMAPGGFLFLGHSETLRGISNEFELLNTHGTFYYRRKDATSQKASTPAAPVTPPEPTAAPEDTSSERDSWIDIIQRSSERIDAVTRRKQPPALDAASPRADPAPRRGELTTALDLFKAERFGEALALLKTELDDAPSNPDVELLAAVIHCNLGEFAEAERMCEKAIRKNESGDHGAAAHYLLGLCRELTGDRPGAMSHHRSATRLDPSFSMPHLHLGILARRAGDLATARAEMRLAADLVTLERPDRIVLFGGGFHRKALLELCRSELNACGESS